MVQLGGFIFASPNMIHPSIPYDICTKPVEELYSFFKPTSKNMGGKKLNEDNLVNSGLNIIGKKIRKGISSTMFSGITLRNNEKKIL